jgi:glycosyltransferase involved in cell wall biosynthesis
MKASPGRVLILVENLSVPFDQRVWREATALTEAGYGVSVICPKGRSFDRGFHERMRGVSIYRYPAYEAASGLLWYGLEYGLALVSTAVLSAVVLLKEGFDVVQICNPPDLLFLVALSYRLMGKPVIFDHHDLSPETYLSKKGTASGGRVASLLQFLERATFKHVDVVMATNESYKAVAVSRGGVAADRVFVVRNGPDLARLAPVAPDPELRRGKQFLVFYAGTMGAQDGVDFLLRSVRHLVRERNRADFHTLIVGGGTELERLKAYAGELGVADAVTFTGRVPDQALVQALFSADVCVCPDPSTPLNDVSTMNKTLEYMAAGKPTVAYDLRETRVSAGNAALYAVPNDERDFADKMERLFDSPALREELGRTGRQRIADGLSWEHSKPSLYAAYERAFSLRTRRIRAGDGRVNGRK